MANAYHTLIGGGALRARLEELWERTGAPELGRLTEHRQPYDGSVLADDAVFSDWVSTALMDVFKRGGDPAVFALLFELNRGAFLQAIQSALRRTWQNVDPQDVLQEVFLNIYRYPHRFQADRADAFRGWGHRIVRNTLLKFLKSQSRTARFVEIDDEAMQPEDVRVRRPERAAIEAEAAAAVDRAYLLYLQLYLLHFGRLSARERAALTMVEIDGASYRDAAAALGVRVENVKMVIFRSRRKIFRGMESSLSALGGLGERAAPRESPPPHGAFRTRLRTDVRTSQF
jgi:RNA polymerase sigma factor (sigma-70 family)